MKKLLICLAVVAFTFSCSNDDDSNGGGAKITAKINGAVKTFNIVSVDAEAGQGTGAKTELYVIAVSGTNIANVETITFSVEEGATGKTVVDNFDYNVTVGDKNTAYFGDEAFILDVVTNANKKLVGTFSGTLNAEGNGTDAVVTDGAFNLIVK